jgi:hypothetical protein
VQWISFRFQSGYELIYAQCVAQRSDCKWLIKWKLKLRVSVKSKV